MPPADEHQSHPVPDPCRNRAKRWGRFLLLTILAAYGLRAHYRSSTTDRGEPGRVPRIQFLMFPQPGTPVFTTPTFTTQMGHATLERAIEVSPDEIDQQCVGISIGDQRGFLKLTSLRYLPPHGDETLVSKWKAVRASRGNLAGKWSVEPLPDGKSRVRLELIDDGHARSTTSCYETDGERVIRVLSLTISSGVLMALYVFGFLLFLPVGWRLVRR